MLILIAAVVLGCASAAADDAASFRELGAEKPAAGDSMAVAGKDGWLFLRSELRHIGVGPFWGPAAAKGSRATSPKQADPLPAIVDFHGQLKAAGIELILVPVPCKAFVYPEKLGFETDERLDTAHQEFYDLLREKGVKVLDLTDVFLQEKAGSDNPQLYCMTDSHWSPYACQMAARRIRDLLDAPAWLESRPDRFATRRVVRTIRGDLAEGPATEKLPARVVENPADVVDGASPIVLLGDSHTLVFHAGAELQGTGAGLADQLAVELGMPIDVIGVRGSGATPARINLMRRARADSDYLAGKKVLVWCFAAREFTESTGWAVFSAVGR